MVTVADAQLLSVLPQAEAPIVPLSLQRPKRTNADTHRAALAVCFTCNVPTYMGDCMCVQTEGYGACFSISAVPVVPQCRLKPAGIPMPTMNMVLHLFSGDYYSEIGVSFMLKQKQIGVIDVDNDEKLGGGHAADITANSVFKLLSMMLECRRIIGILAAEHCSSGSVVRFGVNPDIPDLPEPSRDIEWPDGKQ